MSSVPSGPVVVYDGDCAFCRAQIARIRRRDRSVQFEYVARQTPGLEQRFCRLAEGDFNSGMRLVDPQGRIHVGADAVYEIARRLPVWRRLAWLYRLPIVHGAARLIYKWIAANRQSLGRSCARNECSAADHGR